MALVSQAKKQDPRYISMLEQQQAEIDEIRRKKKEAKRRAAQGINLGNRALYVDVTFEKELGRKGRRRRQKSGGGRRNCRPSWTRKKDATSAKKRSSSGNAGLTKRHDKEHV